MLKFKFQKFKLRKKDSRDASNLFIKNFLNLHNNTPRKKEFSTVLKKKILDLIFYQEKKEKD